MNTLNTYLDQKRNTLKLRNSRIEDGYDKTGMSLTRLPASRI